MKKAKTAFLFITESFGVGICVGYCQDTLMNLWELREHTVIRNLKFSGDIYEVITDSGNFIEVRDAMAEAGLQWETAEATMIPQNQVQLEGKPAETMLKLMDALEDNDDVQNVYANFDISEEELSQIM